MVVPGGFYGELRLVERLIPLIQEKSSEEWEEGEGEIKEILKIGQSLRESILEIFPKLVGNKRESMKLRLEKGGGRRMEECDG